MRLGENVVPVNQRFLDCSQAHNDAFYNILIYSAVYPRRHYPFGFACGAVAHNDGRAGDCVQPLSQNGFDRRICNPADWSIRICNPIGMICFGLQIRMDGMQMKSSSSSFV
jgi:hypothetical protein